MTPGTAVTYYDTIVMYLRENDLGWLINQVQDEVLRGKVITKAVKDINFKNDDQLRISSYKTSKEIISISEPFSEIERLKILLNAIEEMLSINEIKQQIFENLKQINSSVEEIEFLSEGDNEQSHLISKGEIQHENDVIDSLLSEIGEIKIQL